MTILILNRGPLALRPYHQWLTDYPARVLLLTSQEELDLHGERLPPPGAGYAHVEAIADYDTSGRLEARALELARTHDVAHIVACQEYDLERAATLRDILGLPGQGVESATAFRNKMVMKDRARAAGIRVATYAPVETVVDVLNFVGVHGLPVVLKPYNGMSSVGLRIIHSETELHRFAATGFEWPDGSQPNMIAEAFVAGSMYHIDGMVMNGQAVVAWPSQYMYQLASFRNDPGPRLDLTLDPDDPLAKRLLEFLDCVLAALPTPKHTTFHAEVFHTLDDDLVLCEIASRNGGALIKSVMQSLFGVNLPVAWVRASVGLPVPIASDGTRMWPATMAGQLLLLKRVGVMRVLPDPPPFHWVENYVPYVREGERMTGAASSGDFMVAMVASAPSREICEARLRQAGEWFNDQVVIEP